MSEREFGEIFAKLSGLEKALLTNTDTLKLLTEKHGALSIDVGALKVSVPRSAAIRDQKNKAIIVYIAEIAKWVGIIIGIIFGATGADHLIGK